MSEPKPHGYNSPRFSLQTLLLLTAMVALGLALVSAFQRNQALLLQRDALRNLSSRLWVDNEAALLSSGLPRVAEDFYSWNVHVPTGSEHELKLGIGPISVNDVPPVVGSVPISAGQHRVTLHTGDSASESYRFVVYVDGKQVIEKTMGSDWMPHDWSSSSSFDWPRKPKVVPPPLQLSAKTYRQNHDFKPRFHSDNAMDSYVTQKGYRLWIDQADRDYLPASPFIGFPDESKNLGVGLRDGIRYKTVSLPGRPPYLWNFFRPSLKTGRPVLQILPEFFTSEGSLLSSQTPSFLEWQLFHDPRGESDLKWSAEPAQQAYSAYLHAVLATDDAAYPVVEVRWDAARPDEVGLRLADTPTNAPIVRWRLHILDGAKHLWRDLQIDDRTINADDALGQSESAGSDSPVFLDVGDGSMEFTHLQWQTNETLPLQVLQRNGKSYPGMGLYQGLPLIFGAQIPATMHPRLGVRILTDDPDSPGKPFPGGTVFEELQLELDAVKHDWIWLRAEPRK